MPQATKNQSKTPDVYQLYSSFPYKVQFRDMDGSSIYSTKTKKNKSQQQTPQRQGAGNSGTISSVLTFHTPAPYT